MKNATQGRAGKVKGACMKENGAAGGRKRCSPARLAKVGRVAPWASFDGAENAKGI